MFIPCSNSANCPRAGWCKRVTYHFDKESLKHKICFDCSDENHWANYVKNKAREIYERENPNDILRDETFELSQYDDINRESGLRENNVPDSGPGEEGETGNSATSDRVLEFFQCSGGRSFTESPDGADSARTIAEALSFLERAIREEQYRELSRAAGPAILSNPSLNGVSTAEPEPRQLDDRQQFRRVWEPPQL